MRVSRKLPQMAGAAALVVLSLTGQVTAAGDRDRTDIDIDNFGRINANYYRGEQPDPRDYDDLASLGVRTVIDLTKDGEPREQRLVERAGMRFVRIPMTTSDRPSASAIAQFLQLATIRRTSPSTCTARAAVTAPES